MINLKAIQDRLNAITPVLRNKNQKFFIKVCMYPQFEEGNRHKYELGYVEPQDREFIINAAEDISALLEELSKYKVALQKLFSVTPVDLPKNLLNLRGIKEQHAEAVELTRELLWGNKNA